MHTAGQSTSSIHQAFLVLNGACQRAVANGELRTNPITEVRQPVALEPPKVTASEAWDLPALITAAFDYDHDFGVACVLATAIGMGRAELAGLRWDKVNVDRCRIDVCLAVDDAGGQLVLHDLTTTTRARTVELDESTARGHRRTPHPHGEPCPSMQHPTDTRRYVFSQVPDGSAPLGPSYLTRRFRQLTRRLGRHGSDFDTVLHTAARTACRIAAAHGTQGCRLHVVSSEDGVSLTSTPPDMTTSAQRSRGTCCYRCRRGYRAPGRTSIPNVTAASSISDWEMASSPYRSNESGWKPGFPNNARL